MKIQEPAATAQVLQVVRRSESSHVLFLKTHVAWIFSFVASCVAHDQLVGPEPRSTRPPLFSQPEPGIHGPVRRSLRRLLSLLLWRLAEAESHSTGPKLVV